MGAWDPVGLRLCPGNPVIHGVTAILNRLSKSGLIRNPLPPQKIGHDCIEPGSLVPLHPMGAVIEEMEFGTGNPLKKFEAALHRNSAILVAP
jgi:hypothetical protein